MADNSEATVSPAVVAAGVMAFYEVSPPQHTLSDSQLRKIVSHIYLTMKAEEEAFQIYGIENPIPQCRVHELDIQGVLIPGKDLSEFELLPRGTASPTDASLEQIERALEATRVALYAEIGSLPLDILRKLPAVIQDAETRIYRDHADLFTPGGDGG